MNALPAHKIEIGDQSFNEAVTGYVRFYSEVWNNCGIGNPYLGEKCGYLQKRRHERIVKRFLKSRENELNKKSTSGSAAEYDLPPGVIGSLLKDVLGFKDPHIKILMDNKFIDVTKEFVQLAKSFDNTISGEDIFQACRNLWTMNWIQLMLGLSVKLTPSILAYSLLYPYTDNYLDDPDISFESKKEFNRKIYYKLNGFKVDPHNKREEVIFNLLDMIEEQYDRQFYPEVFDSLVAIHNAQIKSMTLLYGKIPVTEEEIVDISLEKGGTSVLADGYLVAGNLNEDQRRFLFGYGAYLQLIDDIQDVQSDGVSEFTTVYTNALKKGLLDDIINRTFGFGFKIIEEFSFCENKNSDVILELTKQSGEFLLIQSVGLSKHYYSRKYFRYIQKYSPLRFSFIKKQTDKTSVYIDMFATY